MATTIPPHPKTATRKATLRKWKAWRDRLRYEFVKLLVQQRHFHELQAVTKPYIGTTTAWELARSIARGYAAFAVTAIRRMAELPQAITRKSREIISLPTLLKDIQANAHLVTRKLQRRRYKKAMKRLPRRIYIGAADRVHDAICRGHDVLSADFVDKDLRLIDRTVKRIKKLADKSYAHIERDRRRIPKNFGFDKIDEAITVLFSILRKYSLCVFGEEVTVPPIEIYSVALDLRKVWPNDAPLPEFPSAIEEYEA